MFTYVPTSELNPLEVRQTDGIREYQLPDGTWVPSVTTILGKSKQKNIDQWRNRVGHAEADEIRDHAARRGTDLHHMVERYLKNERIIFRDENPAILELFVSMREMINRINNIRHIEAQLYSNVLKTAGRVDVIAEFDNVPSIIDFKTTIWEKKESQITSYFEQKTAYSIMYEELTGIKIPQIVTIIGGIGNPQLFVNKRQDFVGSLLQKIEDYHENT